MNTISRREFIRSTALGTTVLLAGGARSHAAAPRRGIPIGVQLYSVGAEFQNNIPGTLAGVKKIGYDAVEFAGYGSLVADAKGLRQLLDDNGLKCCGTHLQGGMQLVTGDAIEKTAEFNHTLGNNKLLVPSMRARTLDDWAKSAETFSAIAEKLKPHKMRIGFHNHVVEFARLEDQIPLDYFFGKASPDVFVQLDIGHCARAGADPVAYLKKFPGRVLSVHVKEYAEGNRAALIGEGSVKWTEIFDACASVAGTEWYIVEEESRAYPGLEGIAKSHANLKKQLG